jgi:2-methylcitrate dehydratase PrpD
LASKSGVFSALLAEKDFKGNRNIFQGPHGYFQQYHGEGGDLERLTSGLGQRYEMVEIGPKGYPCCRGMHASIDATMELASEHDIKPDDVEVIIVYESERNPIITSGGADPDLWGKNRRPQGDVDAQFSLPWGVATAIVKRDVFIENFTGDGLNNHQIQQIAERVKVEIDPELSQVDTMSTPSIVEIRTKSGEVFSKRVNFAKGNPSNPITTAQTIENFRRCAAGAAPPFSEAQAEKALQMMINLEGVGNVKELPQMLAR